MRQKLLLVIAASFIPFSTISPVLANDLEDDQGWVEDETVSEFFPGQLESARPPKPTLDPIQSVDEEYIQNPQRQPVVSNGAASEATEQPQYAQLGQQIPGQFSSAGALYPAFGPGSTPKKTNTFLNPPPVPWLNALGRGARSVGRGTLRTADMTTGALTSPQFWTTAAGLAAMGAAGYGLYRMNKSSGGTYPNACSNPNDIWIDPYVRADGTPVQGHFRTVADDTMLNNYSSRGNVNPYTGRPGLVYPWH